MPTTSQQPSTRLERVAWPIAAVLIVAILTGSGLFLAVRLSEIPRSALQRGRELLRQVQDVATAFRTGTVEISFESFATSIEGSNYLQFATLEKVEVFKLTDRATVFWGTVELPDVVVSATAPVEYTAYLDLNAEWEFRIEGDRIEVTAPPIQFNKPAIDVSKIRYEIEQDSLLRDESAVLETLQIGLTEMSIRRARQHLPMIRGIGRTETEAFIGNWLVQSFTDGDQYDIEVVFADEISGNRGALEADNNDN